MTVPLSLAVVGAIELAALVLTLGAPLVVKVASAPFVVPPSDVATSRKWYVRPACSPPTGEDTGTAVEPDALFAEVFEP